MFEKKKNEKNLAKREFNLGNQNKTERDQTELKGKKSNRDKGYRRLRRGNENERALQKVQNRKRRLN